MLRQALSCCARPCHAAPGPVILSAAKDLRTAPREILRYAQDDRGWDDPMDVH
jgi:hypothetical protein